MFPGESVGTNASITLRLLAEGTVGKVASLPSGDIPNPEAAGSCVTRSILLPFKSTLVSFAPLASSKRKTPCPSVPKPLVTVIRKWLILMDPTIVDITAQNSLVCRAPCSLEPVLPAQRIGFWASVHQ